MQLSSFFYLRIISFLIGMCALTCFYQAAHAQTSLNDIQNNPYRQSIEFLYNNNIVTGNPDGNFAPGNG